MYYTLFGSAYIYNDEDAHSTNEQGTYFLKELIFKHTVDCSKLSYTHKDWLHTLVHMPYKHFFEVFRAKPGWLRALLQNRPCSSYLQSDTKAIQGIGLFT